MSIYRIADLSVQMNTVGRTARYAEPYRVTGTEADITVAASADDLSRLKNTSPDYAEYLATGISFYRQLVAYRGIMLHASCIVTDGRAYLFSAPCGTGKSTHVRLWTELLGDRAYILNDDKPALRVLEGKIYVYGTPWSGKHGINRNARAEFGGIAVLRRAEQNAVRRMEPTEAFYAIMNQTLRAVAPQDAQQCLKTVEAIVSDGRIYDLACNQDISAARLSYETMTGKRK